MCTFKKDYLLSVIIPTHNRGEKLKIAADSVVNQSIGFENVELIIVDDASTDKITKEVMLEYQSKYDNVKCVFMDENSKSCSKPRNIGMNHVTSDYIIFLDDDDTYVENAFEIMYNSIQKYDSDLISFSHYTNINGDLIETIQLNENIINMDPLANQKNFDILTSNTGGSCWSKIFKTKFLLDNNIKFIENIKYEDIPFYLKTLRYSHKVTILSEYFVYIYNVRPNTLVSTHDIKAFNDIIESTLAISKYYENIDNINTNIILTLMVSQTLLVFSNLDKNKKENAILRVYELEKKLKQQSQFQMYNERKEVSILNNALMQKKFKKAILLSNIYKKLYNNNFIRSIYKKYRSN